MGGVCVARAGTTSTRSESKRRRVNEGCTASGWRSCPLINSNLAKTVLIKL